MCKNIFKHNIICFIIGFAFIHTTVKAQTVAVIKNFDAPEIDSLQSYLNSMELKCTVFSKDYLTYDSIANYDLLIWDDLSYQWNGICDRTVSLFRQFYQSGKPLYLIGDDLAYSIINLSQEWASVWTDLLHLTGVNNFSQSYTVLITNTTHPVTNGPYGRVDNFDYDLDIDLATRTNTGELVLATTADSDVLLVYEGVPAKIVTQNCLVVQAGSDISIVERKKLFKNAVALLLNGYTNVNEKVRSLTAKEFFLFQNYPNPFNPITVFGYQLAATGNISLIIYDILGREVTTIANGIKEAGYYTATFDASDFSSGIYFARLTATPTDGSKQYVSVKKLMLMK